MGLLYIYLSSISITALIFKLIDRYIEKEIEKCGYNHTNQKKNVYETIKESVQFFMLLCFPVINIISSLSSIINLRKTCNEYICDSIKTGTLTKKYQLEEIQCQSKKYDEFHKDENYKKQEMTREEKIAFLKEEYSILTGNQMQSENINQKKFRLGKKKNNA